DQPQPGVGAHEVAHQLAGAVGRAVVHDEQARVGRKPAAQRDDQRADGLALVEGGDDDARSHDERAPSSRMSAAKSSTAPNTPVGPSRSPKTKTPSSTAVSGSASAATPAAEAGTSRRPSE